MKSDVVVIGGGVAGLATGALLGNEGKRVTVLEKGNQLGGRAYCYEEKGFTLNYGPHAMYRPETGMLGDVLRRLGRPLIENGYPDALLSYWSDGDRFASLGAKPHQVLTTKLFPLSTRLQVVRLMAAIRFAKPDEMGDVTFGEWIEKQTNDVALRRFANALATINTYTRPASNLSAAFVIRHFQRNLFAKDYVGYMHGGWRSMLDAFTETLEAGGGIIATGAAVEHLEVRDGRVVAAVTHDARYEADAFVCTLPPQDAPAIALPNTPLAAEMAQWSSLDDVRALTIDLGLNRIIRDDLTLVFDVERDLYYSVHSASAPDLAPKGSMMLHAMAYLSAEEANDDALRERRKEDLVAGLDRWFAGWRDALVVERTLPNARVTSARQTVAQQHARVPLRATAASNLYFAGDGRDLPYNLAEICLASAMQVADAVAANGVGQRADTEGLHLQQAEVAS